jgi:hypothetical protein
MMATDESAVKMTTSKCLRLSDGRSRLRQASVPCRRLVRVMPCATRGSLDRIRTRCRSVWRLWIGGIRLRESLP